MAIARALRDELSFGAVSRRENPVAAHIPYSRHVSDEAIRTDDGMLMSFLHLSGFCFETADISEVNSRLLGRNDLLRALGSSRYALYTHIVRREVKPSIASTFDNEFCRELDERYTTGLRQRRMFVNDIYLTVVRRELQGSVGTVDVVLRKLFGRHDADGRSLSEEQAANELSDVMTAMHNPFFDMKFAVTLSLAIPAIIVSLHLSRPEALMHGWGWLLLLPVAMLLGPGLVGDSVTVFFHS